MPSVIRSSFPKELTGTTCPRCTSSRMALRPLEALAAHPAARPVRPKGPKDPAPDPVPSHRPALPPLPADSTTRARIPNSSNTPNLPSSCPANTSEACGIVRMNIFCFPTDLSSSFLPFRSDFVCACQCVKRPAAGRHLSNQSAFRRSIYRTERTNLSRVSFFPVNSCEGSEHFLKFSGEKEDAAIGLASNRMLSAR